MRKKISFASYWDCFAVQTKKTVFVNSWTSLCTLSIMLKVLCFSLAFLDIIAICEPTTSTLYLSMWFSSQFIILVLNSTEIPRGLKLSCTAALNKGSERCSPCVRNILTILVHEGSSCVVSTSSSFKSRRAITRITITFSSIQNIC